MASPVSRRGLNSDRGLASAVIGLGGHDLVVMVSQRHTGRLPSTEDYAHIDGATGPLRLADGPVLLECSSPVDGRLLDASAFMERVGATGMLDRASIFSA